MCAVWPGGHSSQQNRRCGASHPPLDAMSRWLSDAATWVRYGVWRDRHMTGRPLLFAVSLVSLSSALLASASAETCVTGVSSAFANVLNGVSGQPGATVVTAVTPTMSSALTNVTANPGAVPFLTGATLNQTTGPAVTTVMAPTTSITGLQPGATNNLIVPAFDPNANPSNTFFAFANGSNTTKGSGGVELVNTNTPTPTITLTNTTVVSGTVAPPQTVVMNVSAPQSQFLTSASLTTSTSPTNAITSVTPTSAQFVSGLNVSTANVLTNATTTTTPVVNSVAVSNSGASAPASS